MRSNRQQHSDSQKSCLQTTQLNNLKIRSKDTLLDNLNLKQETYSPVPVFHTNLTHLPSPLTTANSSSLISSLDAANNSFNQSICTLQQHQQHQQSKNIQFISKPSKWLYSSSRSSVAAFHHDHNNNDMPEYRCFISGAVQNQSEFNSDPSFQNKVARKAGDFNNNNVNNSNNNNNNNNNNNRLVGHWAI